MNNTTFFNITPIDGRYKNLTVSLKALFTEYAFIKQRVIIEIKYFLFLLKLNNDAFPHNDKLRIFMENLSNNIFFQHIDSIKQIENEIHHDVKSIEYFLTKQWISIPSHRFARMQICQIRKRQPPAKARCGSGASRMPTVNITVVL